MAELESRIVLALDYGTTYTGVAYGWAGSEHNNPNLGVEDAGDGMTDCISWPVRNQVKVPSQIAYSSSHEHNSQWGYDISPEALRLIWTKLELEKQNRVDELNHLLRALDGMKDLDLNEIAKTRGLPEYPAKEPVEIISDYLSLVCEHVVKRDMPYSVGEALFESSKIDLVVTCPTIWSYSAKNLTLKAIQNAGFNTSNFENFNEIIVVSEPVAAALYALKSIQEDEDEPLVKVGECFITADCGGGTVDVAAFQVIQLKPVISLREIGIGIGQKCGSTFIDSKLKKNILDRIGPSNSEKLSKELPEGAIGGHQALGVDGAQLLESIQIVKERWDGSDNFNRLIRLPQALAGPDAPERGITNGQINLTGEDLKRAFHDCVEGTIQLISAKMGQVQRFGSLARFVALVGGLACSDHLFHEVNRWTTARKVPTKRPARKENTWAAVARGAVMYGLQRRTESTVYMRPAAHNYGVKTQQPFSAFKHSGNAIYQDPFDAQQKAENQMTWLVNKGDLILSDTPIYASLDICRKFRAQDSKSFCTHLLVNDDDRAPMEYLQNEMRTVGVLNYNLGGIPDSAFQRIRMPGSRVHFYKADLKLHIQITVDDQVKEVRFWVTFNDQELSSITLNYP